MEAFVIGQSDLFLAATYLWPLFEPLQRSKLQRKTLITMKIFQVPALSHLVIKNSITESPDITVFVHKSGGILIPCGSCVREIFNFRKFSSLLLPTISLHNFTYCDVCLYYFSINVVCIYYLHIGRTLFATYCCQWYSLKCRISGRQKNSMLAMAARIGWFLARNKFKYCLMKYIQSLTSRSI